MRVFIDRKVIWREIYLVFLLDENTWEVKIIEKAVVPNVDYGTEWLNCGTEENMPLFNNIWKYLLPKYLKGGFDWYLSCFTGKNAPCATLSLFILWAVKRYVCERVKLMQCVTVDKSSLVVLRAVVIFYSSRMFFVFIPEIFVYDHMMICLKIIAIWKKTFTGSETRSCRYVFWYIQWYSTFNFRFVTVQRFDNLLNEQNK